MKVKLKDGELLTLAPVPFGRGGEGNVHIVAKGQGGRSHLIAKLYKPEKNTLQQEQKIDFLVANAPSCESGGHTYLIWPQETLSQGKKFVGFLMPRASGVELEKLCLANLDETLGPEWQRFAHGSAEAMLLRLSLCRNLSHAVAAVHQKRCYVLVDMKPVNIFVNAKAMVSIIDLDSVQVTDRGHLLYANKAFTPEYTPPEAINQDKIRTTSWDDFTLAVILYRLLTGIHPFTGSYKNASYTEVSSAINAGLYPHGPKKSAFRVIPPLHQRLLQYPSAVIKLFSRSFIDGIHNPAQRPTAKEWFGALNDLLSAPPVVKSFSCSSDLVSDFSPIRLQWEVEHTVSIYISGIGDVTAMSEADVTVKQNTTFILRATSFSGKQVEKSISIKTDLRPPEIKVFEASNLVVSAGDAIALRWDVQRAATVSLTPSTGKVSACDSVSVQPAVSTRYKLTAVSCFGVESSQVLDILVHPAPEISEFTLSHSKVKPGKVTTLTWRCNHYQRVELSDGTSILDVSRINSVQLKPFTNTDYKLKVTGLAGLKEKVATVSVEVLPDTKIDEFTANRLITIQTVPTELRWKSRHAKKLILEPGGVDVTGTSSLKVFPTVATTYELIATHELHETRKRVRIDVTPLPRMDSLRIPQPPNLQLKPPSKVWPLLPELLSGVADPEEKENVFSNQVLPGKAPFTGAVSRMLSHVLQLMKQAQK